MEPQGRGKVPARHTPERDKRLGLSKTTLESRVHVQTSWAECRDKKGSASSRRRDISLDIPFYRTSTRTASIGGFGLFLHQRIEKAFKKRKRAEYEENFARGRLVTGSECLFDLHSYRPGN